MTDRKRIAARAGTRRPRPVLIGHTHDDDCTLDEPETALEARVEREIVKRPHAARWRRSL